MTKKKKTHTKLSIIIKKRTIGNLHTNASNAKNLSMMHLLRLPTNEKWTKAKKKHLNGTNDSSDNEQRKRQSKNAKIVKRLCN